MTTEDDDEESGNSSLTCTLEDDVDTDEEPEEVDVGMSGALREVGDLLIVMSLGLF